jgi:acyl-CoA thioesterase-1
LIAACNRGATPPNQAAPAPPSAAATPSSASETGRPKIVVLGDSLSAGYGLLESQAFPALLQKKLDADGYKWEVVNAGISGDTTAAGLQRLDWALSQGDVRILVLELGANDGLRGLPVSEMKKNLAAIIERSREKGITVLLAGMEAPPNFGPEYVVSFRQVYRDLAREHKVTLLPFLLDKVAGVATLNQGDGIHPNIEGTAIVADNVWNVLRPMVDAVSSSSGGLRPPEPPHAVARGGPVPRSRLRQGFGEARRSGSAAKAAAPAAHSLRSFAAAA